jgi:hypothetical protein
VRAALRPFDRHGLHRDHHRVHVTHGESRQRADGHYPPRSPIGGAIYATCPVCRPLTSSSGPPCPGRRVRVSGAALPVSAALISCRPLAVAGSADAAQPQVLRISVGAVDVVDLGSGAGASVVSQFARRHPCQLLPTCSAPCRAVDLGVTTPFIRIVLPRHLSPRCVTSRCR